jgi:hypothetical protein
MFSFFLPIIIFMLPLLNQDRPFINSQSFIMINVSFLSRSLMPPDK